MHQCFSSLAVFIAIAFAPLPANARADKPFPPAAARKLFHLPKGLKIELVACEPQVESPVAMSFDPQGRLWVVEMRDYPNGPPPGKRGQGRIRILEDKDGDGFFETSRVFADELLFANGLMHWKDGVVVTAAPHILWLRDTDGDGKADKSEVLYEGFMAGNPQLRVSHPVLGLDGWVYVANGLRGGTVKAAGKPDAKIINLSGMDFRFNLLTGEHEAISGMGQFGNAFDDWGNRFVCDNRHHLRHIVLENRYLKNNPQVTVPSLVEDISILDDGPLSSGGKIYPLSKNWTTSNLHEGRFTAACGVFIYRGGFLPKEYHGAAFTCDPTGNLVHVERLEPHGATFKATPLFKEMEFLATPDDWCRPVFLAHGPDDALYMVDMYRAVIEHPEFMPPELKKRPDLMLGADKGRIWRIVPEAGAARKIELAGKSNEELCASLASSHAWARMTAYRLLLERQDKEALPLLRRTLSHADPRARAQAAWLLNLQLGLTEKEIVTLLKDGDARVGGQALLLAEGPTDPPRPVRDATIALMTSSQPRTSFQASLSQGAWDYVGLREMGLMLVQHSDDRWLRSAVYLALKGRAGGMIHHLLTREKAFRKLTNEQQQTVLAELGVLVGARADLEECQVVLQLLSDQVRSDGKNELPLGVANFAVPAGLAEGLGRRGSSLQKLVKDLTPVLGEEAGAWLELVLRWNEDRTRDPKAAMPERLRAVTVVAQGSRERAAKTLLGLIAGEHPLELKLAAARTVSRFQDGAAAGALLAGWKSYSPALRREVVEGLLRHPVTITPLLQAVEEKTIRPTEIDPLRTKQLLGHAQPAIRDRAKKLLAASLPADRKEVLDKYQAALKLTGDAKRGQAIFAKHCVTCHRVAGIGVDVGPDISDTRTKAPAALLADILSPNLAIDANYIQYLVTTTSGRSVVGVLAAETASSVTVKRAEGQQDVVPRSEIDTIESTGVSLMPEGLERDITTEQMADLLAFLKNWRYLDGSVPAGK